MTNMEEQPLGNARKKAEKLESLRERLYSRDGGSRTRARTKLEPVPVADVRRQWTDEAAPARKTTPPPPPANDMASRKPTHNYRTKALLASVIFFAATLVLSSVFFIWGNNSISGENIDIRVQGPFAVGGGEEMQLQISIENHNAVPIQSATLIIEYPQGTQAVDESRRELFIERMPLESIKPGSLRNMTARAVVFGEENDEKTVHVSIEYRVEGSNAIFYKEAEPLRFKISSSPVVLDVEAVETSSAGQEIELALKVRSNSPTPLQGVLVKADYPFGFDFSSAEPSPAAARNTWRIEELLPEEEETIVIKGVVTGGQEDVRHFDFTVGLPAENDRFALASVFTKNSTEIGIEAPFLGVDIDVNGSSQDVVVIQDGESADVRITFENTRNDTVYDGEVAVKLGGNALSEIDVRVQEGFYNSQTDTVYFDGASRSSLREIPPGESRTVNFSIEPRTDVSQTPEIDISVSVRANRVSEGGSQQELTASDSAKIRVEGASSLSSAASHAAGPMPPTAEEATDFVLTFSVTGGGNDVTNAQMTASIPQYVQWADAVSGGSVTYNSGTRTMTWNIGTLDANQTKTVSAAVTLTPSLAQVGQIPAIVDRQFFSATDRFTGTKVRAEAPLLTTASAGGSSDGGRVQED